MSVRLFGLLAAALLLGGCPTPAPPPGGAPSEDGSGTEEAHGTNGSGSEADEPVEEPAATAPSATGPSATAPSAGNSEASAPDEGAPRPPNLAVLMRGIGYTDASPASLDEFVHLPPGAEGEAGTFGSGERTVRVALIGYPNRHYARPHVTDVAERNRVLPAPREAIASNGRWVVHVAAADRESAEAVVERVREALDWPAP